MSLQSQPEMPAPRRRICYAFEWYYNPSERKCQLKVEEMSIRVYLKTGNMTNGEGFSA